MREKRRPLRWGGQDAPSVLAASISTPKQKANRIQNASWEVAEEDKDATADAYEGADVEENEAAPSVMASVAAPKKPKVRVVSRNVKCATGNENRSASWDAVALRCANTANEERTASSRDAVAPGTAFTEDRKHDAPYVVGSAFTGNINKLAGRWGA
eukprot:CAMPEP_0198686428 /NCGR_PEP_ID=MMETSP1468-20131203/14887_1 /TAXON_ID=1461545 /ORGANISM="Mantoniella sp, Strain CCMP1436" /LENGTH=156 /DNA_ID=CAMNT_0044432519 /DNA_START=407 /DNA_END=878 /DNA_ORIENTATION=+